MGSAHTSFSSHPSPNTQKSKPILTRAKHMMPAGWPLAAARRSHHAQGCQEPEGVRASHPAAPRRPDLADPPPAATRCKVPGRACQTTEAHRPASKPELPVPERQAAPGLPAPLHTPAHLRGAAGAGGPRAQESSGGTTVSAGAISRDGFSSHLILFPPLPQQCL